MTLLQLKYIVAIDQYGHFGKAAEACGLTQSTLSLMLKKLEEELVSVSSTGIPIRFPPRRSGARSSTRRKWSCTTRTRSPR